MMKKEQKQGLFPQVYSGRRLAQLLQELRLTLLRLASDWQLLCRVLCFHVTRVSGNDTDGRQPSMLALLQHQWRQGEAFT